jgi:hypothetical protein
MLHNRFLAGSMLAAIATLVACDRGSEVVVINKYDPQAEALKNAAPVAPPPMITESKAYRCRDNSLVFIDFYTNNSASIRTERRTPPIVTVTAEGGNPPYVAEGYSVSGSGNEISYTAPGKGTQTCTA